MCDPMPDADANNRAVARVISLLNEIVERARYPHSESTPAASRPLGLPVRA